MDYLRKYLTTNTNENQPSGIETVEKLVDRLLSATLIDDRRDAIRALKSLSKKFRLEVGTQAMHVVLDVLDKDRNDAEIACLGLEALENIMCDEMTEEFESNNAIELPHDLGGQFTEIFINKGVNVELVLSFIDEYEFYVRRHAVHLLTVLLKNRSKEVQEAILQCPMGVSKLVDLLADSREVVRNDGILLLTELTQSNTNIQKIVAFENVFERLLCIVEEEGKSDGGVIVEDCLRLLLQLLKNNAPNQTLFKEGSFVRRLTGYFHLSQDDTHGQRGWSAQKVANVQLMLQVLRTLVSPSNKAQALRAVQQEMFDCGLLPALCEILMASGVPAEVLTETIHTVSEAVRGCPSNQDYLAGVMAPSEPPQPAITVLLMSMVNEKQPFVLRVAVLYCFECFLYKNKNAQAQIVQTLLPKSAEMPSVSAGQLLCGGLFSHDALSAWFASVALLHAVHENTQLKDDLLRVHLATTLGSRPVTLLQQCSSLLSQGIRFQGKVGLLMLLITWLSSAPVVVRKFLGEGDTKGINVSTLISEMTAVDNDETEVIYRGLCALLFGVCVRFNPGDVKGYDSDSLIQLIERRMGVDMFIERLSQVVKVEAYTKAMRKPQPHYKQASEVVFDYEFTRLFKYLEHEVVNAVQQVPTSESPEEKQRNMAQFAEHESVVNQYKDLISQQDQELTSLRGSVVEFEKERETTSQEIGRLKEDLQKLSDQNVLLKASKGPKRTGSLPSLTDAETEVLATDAPLVASPSADQEKVDQLESQLASRTEEVEHLRGELSRMTSASGDKETDNEALSHTKEELDRVRMEVKEWEVKCTELTAQLEATTHVKDRVETLERENKELHDHVANISTQNSSEKIKSLESRLTAAEEERDSTKQEHEDLLVLLTDQDVKIKELKAKIRELGGEVEDDEDDDDDLDDLNDDDEDGEGSEEEKS